MSQPSVLIVDDDEDVRHALCLVFQFEGFNIIGEASNGLDAIAITKRDQPDFVVLDYLMPHMDGGATAQVIRAIAPSARIVAFSAILEEKPEWADAFLNKDRISEIAPLLTRMMSLA